MEIGSYIDLISLIASILFFVVATWFTWISLNGEQLSRTKKILRSLLTGVVATGILGLLIWLAFLYGKSVGEKDAPVIQEVTVEVPIEVTRIVLEEVEVTREVEVDIFEDNSNQATENISEPTASFTPYTLDLSDFDEGDLAQELGTNIVVRQEGEKFIDGRGSDGAISIQNLVLTGKFRVNIRILVPYSFSTNTKIAFRPQNGASLEFGTDYRSGFYRLNFDNREGGMKESPWIGGEMNTLTLEFDTDLGQAKLLINGEFYDSASIESGSTYTNITITGITQNTNVWEISAQQIDG